MKSKIKKIILLAAMAIAMVAAEAKEPAAATKSKSIPERPVIDKDYTIRHIEKDGDLEVPNVVVENGVVYENFITDIDENGFMTYVKVPFPERRRWVPREETWCVEGKSFIATFGPGPTDVEMEYLKTKCSTFSFWR